MLPGSRARSRGSQRRRTSLAVSFAELKFFLDLALDRTTFHETQAVDEEASVEVVEFVLDRHGEEAFRLEHVLVPFYVLVFDRNFLGAKNLFVFPGDAKAAFLKENLAFFFLDLGIDKDARILVGEHGRLVL